MVCFTVPLMAVGGCGAQSDVERQREAAVAAAEREVHRSPIDGLPRAGAIGVSDRARWRPVLQWPESCEEAFQASRAGEDGGMAFHTLGPGLWTVEVLCAAGSYQPSHVFLRFDERGSSPMATLLEFPVYESEDGQRVTQRMESELFGETTFSADGRTLSLLSLARQLGDCGTWTRYRVSTERPKLVAAAARLPCGAAPGDAVDWKEGAAPPGWRPLNP